ncbi:MAG: hypothetical protein IKM99_09120 [Bacteroidales bacterium]|nr:hypothetical protein [Bacteroidales bacterium]
MIGQSGCFGNTYEPPIDDIHEAGAAVTDIMEGMTVGNPEPCAPDPSADLAARLLCVTMRRVRLLTWAVLAVVAYLVIKEID